MHARLSAGIRSIDFNTIGPKRFQRTRTRPPEGNKTSPQDVSFANYGKGDSEMSEIVLVGSTAYIVIGMGVAIFLPLAGYARIDAATRDSGLAFRVLISPGVVALWPLMLSRWLRGEGHPPEERNCHRKRPEGHN